MGRGNNKAVARQLYFSGYTLGEIASKVGVSERTISEWAAQNDWRRQKTAMSISRAEIVSKNLSVIAGLLEYLETLPINNDTISTYSKVVDQLTKLTAVIEKLDTSANVVSAIDVLDDFAEWLDSYAEETGALTSAEIDKLEVLFDTYVADKLNSEKK